MLVVVTAGGLNTEKRARDQQPRRADVGVGDLCHQDVHVQPVSMLRDSYWREQDHQERQQLGLQVMTTSVPKGLKNIVYTVLQNIMHVRYNR